MTLFQLESFDESNLVNKYQSKKHTFPLIISVLKGIQEGVVYSDGKHANYLVIHKFGFADLIETEESTEFDTSLYHFLLEKKFLIEKLRWYNVPKKWVTKFKNMKDKNFQLAERVQLFRDSFDPASEQYNDDTVFVEQVTESNFDFIDGNFDLSMGARFWSSRQQFLNNSLGIAVTKNGIPVSLCYACAIANAVAEIDIFTKEAFRGQGLGKLAVAAFINLCIAKEVKVHWDCYTNNKPSFFLAKYFCFNPYHTYSYAIISK